MMHPFPCSALLTCFGSIRESAPFDPPEPNCLPAVEIQKVETSSAISSQPSAKTTNTLSLQRDRAGGEISPHSHCAKTPHSAIANGNSSNHTALPCMAVVSDSSASPAEVLGSDTVTVHTHIPRPSIIRVPKEKQEQKQMEIQTDSDLPASDNDLFTDNLSGESEFREPSLILRNIMAEPDYIDEDNPELIRPQKLVNPVKTSRNHQDLHRELRMNQKRGLAPQNKPELQKVMERRKRDQVIKQKEEEAQQKKSDFEIELLKRQQKLEQLELEKQKIQEEQENAPEFVKVKGNLRRTAQESAEAQTS
ncbi:protein FAM107B isoform X1 [Varanus komodoensis]|nr:protein FAM107B isoform X1 [Varanus komodoensis]